MTSTTGPRGTEPRGTEPPKALGTGTATTTARRRTVAIVAAGLVVVVVTAIIALAGIVPYPSFPTLAAAPQPEPPGRVAFTRWEDREGTCLYVATPAGAVHQVRCGDEVGGYGTGWESPGRLAIRSYGPGGDVVEIVDADTGDTLATRPGSTPDKVPPTEPGVTGRVVARSADGHARLLVNENGSLRTLLDVTGPDSYRFSDPTVSPDGGWAVLSDSADRLLVVRLTGEPAPRIWATHAGNAFWEPRA